MEYRKLFAVFGLTVLSCFCALSVFAENASSDSADSSLTDSASSVTDTGENESNSETVEVSSTADSESPPETFTASQVTEILEEYPNAFTPAKETEDTEEKSETSGMYTAGQSDSNEIEQAETSVQTIWDKDFNEYTPTEGLLLLLFIMAVSVIMFKIVRWVWL